MIFIGILTLISSLQYTYACIGGTAPASCCSNGCANSPRTGCASARPIVAYQTQQSPQYMNSQYIAPGQSHNTYAQVPQPYAKPNPLYVSNQYYSSGISQQSYIPPIPQQIYSQPQQQYVPFQQQYYSGPSSQPSYINTIPTVSGNYETAKAIYQTGQETVSKYQTFNLDKSNPVPSNIPNPVSKQIKPQEAVKDTFVTTNNFPSVTENKVVNHNSQGVDNSNIITQNYNEQEKKEITQNVIKTDEKINIHTTANQISKSIVEVSPSATNVEEIDYHDQESEPEVTSKETIMKTNVVPFTNEVMPPNPPAVGSQLDGKVETVQVSVVAPKGPEVQFSNNEKIYTEEKHEVVHAPGVSDEKVEEISDNVHIGEANRFNNNNNIQQVPEIIEHTKVIENILTNENFEKTEPTNSLKYEDISTKEILSSSPTTEKIDPTINTSMSISTTEELKQENVTKTVLDTPTVAEISTVGEVSTVAEIPTPALVPLLVETSVAAETPTVADVYTPKIVVENTDGTVYEEPTTIKITTVKPIVITEPERSYRIRRIYFRHRN
uniref:Ground-like domain-containing protein n=1 Tax=Parastrongyloides trichosuri TaxID=131310 RepID=A0A0N4ZCL8_PARTI